MTFVVPNRQDPDALSVLQVFGTKTQTFWGSLSAQPRADSVNSSIHRSFYQQTAWDISGPVLDHWNEVLVHAVHATFKSHRNDILRGRGWDGAINCWMIGDRTECAVPKVVVSCIDLSTVKRFMRKIVKDACWQASGFGLVGRRGCLRYTAGDEKERPSISMGAPHALLYSTIYSGVDHTRTPPSTPPHVAHRKIVPATSRSRLFTSKTVEFSGLEVIIQSRAGLVKEEETKTTTVGGLILVEDAFYYLCVAHAFIAHQAASPTATTNETLEKDDGPEKDLISWHGTEESCGDWHDESSDESDQSDETLTMSGALAANTFTNEHNFFEAADAFLKPSTSDRQTKLRLGESIASFTNETAEKKSNVGLEKDWALLTPEIEPNHMINQVQFQGRPLNITRLGKLSPNTKTLLVRSKYGEPRQVECSRAVSLIPSLAQGTLNSAHIVNERIGTLSISIICDFCYTNTQL